MAKMRAAAEPLIEKLDKDNLWGVVDKLTKLFPEFADEIKKAADKAAETEGYDELKKKLEEIVDLQSKVTANNSLREIANARQNRLQNTISEGISGPKAGKVKWADDGKVDILAAAIWKAASYKDEKGNTRLDRDQFKMLSEQVAAVIAQHVTDNGAGKADTLNKTLKSMGVEMRTQDIFSIIDALMTGDSDAKAAHDAVMAINNNTKAVDAARDAINGKPDDGKPGKPGKDPDKTDTPDTTPKDTPEKIKERLTGKIAAANDDLAQGFITSEERLRKLSQAYMDAYQELRSLTGATGADNEYTGKAKLYNYRVKAAPIKKVKGGDLLTGKAEPSVKAVPVKPVFTDTGWQPEPVKIPVTFEDVSGAVSDITGSLGSVYGAADSVGQAFEKLADDSATA